MENAKRENEKQTILQNLFSQIYRKGNTLVLSKQDIARIEAQFKKNSCQNTDPDAFIQSDLSFWRTVDFSSSMLSEIRKQIQSKKSLQSGILFECAAMKTLANLMGLKCFVDMRGLTVNEIPPTVYDAIVHFANEKKIKRNDKDGVEKDRVWSELNTKTMKNCPVRYAYYSDCQGCSDVILQCGNPKTNDCIIRTSDVFIVAEIKDAPALLIDTDLLYHEDGSLIAPKRVASEINPFITAFNKSGAIFNRFGSNYNLEDAVKKRGCMLGSFFDGKGVDVIFSSAADADKREHLICLKPEDMDAEIGGQPILDIAGSEIRTVGKNNRKKVFTQQYLNKVLAETNVSERVNGVCEVSDTSMIIGWIKGRGTDEYTRYRIAGPFFVHAKDITVDVSSGTLQFRKSAICQSKAGISIHVNRFAAYESIVAYFANRCNAAVIA